MNRLCNRIKPFPALFWALGGIVHTCAFTVTAIGDPALRPGIPQPWYWHGTVPQGSDRFNLTEEASPPNLFLSSCTYSMVDNESRRIESITSLSLNPPPPLPCPFFLVPLKK